METQQLINLLQMSQLECATLKVANNTLRERIQWLEHLCNEYQEQLQASKECEEKHNPIGFGARDE